MQVVFVLGGIMLVLGEKAETIGQGKEMLQKCIDSGEGFERFLAMTQMQGGDCSVLRNPDAYPVPDRVIDVLSLESGYIGAMDAFQIGVLARELGAGRIRQEDRIDPGAGLILFKKVCDPVEKGSRVAALYTGKNISSDELQKRFLDACTFADKPPQKSLLIQDLIDEKKEWVLPDERSIF